MVIVGHLFKKNLETGDYEMVLSRTGYDFETIKYFVKYCDRVSRLNYDTFDLYFVEYFKVLEDGCFPIGRDKVLEILDGLLSSK